MSLQHGVGTEVYMNVFGDTPGQESDSRRLSPRNDPDSKGKCKVMCFIVHDAMNVDWRAEV